MAIKLTCGCGKSLSVKDEYAGRKVTCPACKKPLKVPAAEEFADEEFADEPAELPRKSRTKGAKKGKKSAGSNRGLIIGAMGGAGLLVVLLLAWMFWPAKPDNVANAPATGATATVEPSTVSETNTTAAIAPRPEVMPTSPSPPATLSQNAAESPSSPGANPTSVNPGSPVNASPVNPPVPTSTSETKLEGDLKLLQGTWQVADVGVEPDRPGAAAIIAEGKKLSWIVEDDILRRVAPYGASLSSMTLDSTKEPKEIDLFSIEEDGKKTGLGIYSLDGDSWTVCVSFTDAVRPTEMLPNKALNRIVLTLKRGTPAAFGDGAATPVGLKFDAKAWQQASGKLKAMNVNANMNLWERYAGTEALTHCVVLHPPDTEDGTMSAELWAIVSSISPVVVQTTFATDATLRQLAQHPGLLGVNMDTRSTVTASGIGALKACPHLQMLMFHVPVSPEVCEASTQLEHLRGFGISNTPVSKDMLSTIVRLSQLESLILLNTGTTDDDALQFQKLTKLRYLDLSNSQLTDEGLKTLASLTQLKGLEIDESKVTDQGLQTLKSLTGLMQLSVSGLKVTPQGLAELVASLPNCGKYRFIRPELWGRVGQN